MFRERLFGTNGIRGLANVELTPEFALKIAQAIGTFFEAGRVAVGCDGRTSSPMLKSAVVSGLTSAGCKVYDAGMVPTPALQYAVKAYGMDGGVMITASHNPPEYNGIKVMASDGVELPRELEVEVERIFFEGGFKPAGWSSVGRVLRLPGVLEAYAEAVLRHVDREAIGSAGFKVVLDPGNGVSALIYPSIVGRLGCRVVAINSNVDGRFPGRPPEPRPENLTALSSTVRFEGADLGVAYDGDGDRAIFSDERGVVHWGDRSFALVEKHFLSENPGELVVTPVSSSKVVEDVASEYGGRVVWTRVGSVTVSRTMLKLGAKLGGEENGGVFYGPHQPVRDGAMTTALILEIMAEERRSLSELLNELPRYHQLKDKVPCPEELKKPVLEEIRRRVSGARVETLDGVKVWFEDGSWILVRPSGTEPIYRLYAEASTEERVSELVEEFKQLVSEVVSSLKS